MNRGGRELVDRFLAVRCSLSVVAPFVRVDGQRLALVIVVLYDQHIPAGHNSAMGKQCGWRPLMRRALDFSIDPLVSRGCGAVPSSPARDNHIWVGPGLGPERFGTESAGVTFGGS